MTTSPFEYLPFHDLQERVLLFYARKTERSHRGYIGASLLGHTCERRIWLDWKGITIARKLLTEDPLEEGKREEKFARGREEEERLIKALQGAGYIVISRQREFSVFEDNFRGHIDGIILDHTGKQYILEIKSCQDKYIKALLRNGVQKTFFSYFLQCQMYMHFFSLSETLFLGVNKNNGEIYQEILRKDQPTIEKGLEKINRIMSHGKEMPAALAGKDETPPKMPCQYCEFFSFCYRSKENIKNEAKMEVL